MSLVKAFMLLVGYMSVSVSQTLNSASSSTVFTVSARKHLVYHTYLMLYSAEPVTAFVCVCVDIIQLHPPITKNDGRAALIYDCLPQTCT